MKNIYRTIFLLIFNSAFLIFAVGIPLDNSFSQTAPAIQWQKCLGGTDYDAGFSVQQTNDRGFIVGGSSRSNNGNVSGNHGGSDYWAVKLDSAGAIQWQKCLGGSGQDFGQTIRQPSNGGYIFSGTTTSNNGDVSSFHGYADTWVVNLDSAGNIVWQKCLGGTWDENNGSIIQTTDGGFASISWLGSNDGDATSNYGVDDYWLVKQDSAGNIEWQKNYGGTAQDMGNDIVQTSDGGYLLSGSTLSVDSDVTGNHGFVDSWIVKVDSIGNLQWQKCLGGSGQDESLCAIQVSDGGYIVTSRCNSNDGNVSGSHGNTEGWVVKLDAAGTIVWQKCYGGTNHDFFFYAAETSGKNILLVGATYSNDGDVSGNNDTTGNFSDVWVVKTDSIGNIIWQKCVGGSNHESAYNIEGTYDGGSIISGFTNSNNGDVSGYHGGQDFWVIKLAPDTITGISPTPALPEGEGVAFAPNPLTDKSKLTFNNPNKEKFLFTLYDITGRVVETDNYPSLQQRDDEIILTKGSKPAGVYLFNLVNEKTGERWMGKIVIQ